MFAKRFFFICAGILCLALAYQLGVRNAGAQVPGQNLVGYVGPAASEFAVVVDRVVYKAANGLPLQPLAALPPVPGSSPVLTFASDNALLANGDVYDWIGSGWRYKGNVLGGAPTPTTEQSWGQLKARYR